MALPSLATVDDLADWLGETIASDDPKATAILFAASTLVRSFTGMTGVDDWVTTVPDDAKVVTVMVSARLWANPKQASQEATTLGTYSHSASWRGDGLYLTQVEKSMLDQYGATSGLWVQPTTRGEIVPETGSIYYVDVAGGDPMPFLVENPNW